MGDVRGGCCEIRISQPGDLAGFVFRSRAVAQTDYGSTRMGTRRGAERGGFEEQCGTKGTSSASSVFVLRVGIVV